MKDLQEVEYEEKLQRLRVKYLKAQKEGDGTMCSIILRQVKALKIAYGKDY